MYQKRISTARHLGSRPDSTTEEAIEVLLENDLSGAPAIDDGGRI